MNFPIRRPTATLFFFIFITAWTVRALAAGSTMIVINIPAFRLDLYEEGRLTRSYPVAVGRSVKPSKLGETKIINVVHQPTYYPPHWFKRGLEPIPPGPDNPVGTRWLGLGFKGYGIHGTNSPDSIGKAVSSGCIRMHNADVEELARLVHVGTPVHLIYDTVELSQEIEGAPPYITVHPDIYRQGTNTLTAIQERLNRMYTADPIDTQALHAIVHEASGAPIPVPTRPVVRTARLHHGAPQVTSDRPGPLNQPAPVLTAMSQDPFVGERDDEPVDDYRGDGEASHTADGGESDVGTATATLRLETKDGTKLILATAAVKVGERDFPLVQADDPPVRVLPSAVEMTHMPGPLVFPKGAVGLVDGRTLEVELETVVGTAGSPLEVRPVRVSGIEALDVYAQAVAERGLTYQPFDETYAVHIVITYDASSPQAKRVLLTTPGSIKPGARLDLAAR